jgi:hypothetical protein
MVARNCSFRVRDSFQGEAADLIKPRSALPVLFVRENVAEAHLPRCESRGDQYLCTIPFFASYAIFAGFW